MPNEPTPAMRTLVNETETDIYNLMSALEVDAISLDDWDDEMQQVLTRHHMTSYMLGQGGAGLGAVETAALAVTISEQLEYLRNFKLIMQSSDEFMAGWYARAEMYASAMNSTYWSGKTKIWPLPAMPGQGTDCLTNCRCSWKEDNINAETGDGDFYWELDPFVADEQHCETCLMRAQEWSPILVRGGELIL